MDFKTINQLSSTFSAQDIMTARSVLKRAKTLDDARNLFGEYDVVPYPRIGKIEGFFKRDSEFLHNIEKAFIVSDGTSLFELPELFCENSFYFVISANSVVGYVHYSDLNKPLVKIPFFALFQAIERKLWDKIENQISENVLRNLFPNEIERFLRLKRKAEQNNVEIGWMGIFTFPYILKIARHFGATDLPDTEIKKLKELRNKVSHSDQYLVTNKNSVKELADSQALCWNLIKN